MNFGGWDQQLEVLIPRVVWIRLMLVETGPWLSICPTVYASVSLLAQTTADGQNSHFLTCIFCKVHKLSLCLGNHLSVCEWLCVRGRLGTNLELLCANSCDSKFMENTRFQCPRQTFRCWNSQPPHSQFVPCLDVSVYFILEPMSPILINCEMLCLHCRKQSGVIPLWSKAQTEPVFQSVKLNFILPCAFFCSLLL